VAPCSATRRCHTIVFAGVVTLVITLVSAKRWIAESETHSGDVAVVSPARVEGVKVA